MTVEAESVIKPGDDLRVGDRVELIGEVVEFKPYMTTIRFRAAPLVSDRDLPNGVVLAGRRVERPLAVGDRVRLKHSPALVGTIKAVDGPEAWIGFDGQSCNETRRLPDLERASAEVKDSQP